MQIFVDNGVMEVRNADAGAGIVVPSGRLLRGSTEPLRALLVPEVLVVLAFEAVMLPIAFLGKNDSNTSNKS